MSVTRDGDQWWYDNYRPGVAKAPDLEGVIHLTFVDKDNSEVHLFPMPVAMWDRYKQHVDEEIKKGELVVPE